MPKRLTHEQFLKRVKEVHGNEYEYLEKYVKSSAKIKIRHRECGNIFLQISNDHLRGCGCPKCGSLMGAEKIKKKARKYFIKRVKEIHNNEYEYLEKYVDAKTKIKMRHKKCGNVFSQTPDAHLQGQGCPECGAKKGKARMTMKEFEQQAHKIHGDAYEYLEDYVNNTTRINIKHKKCEKIFLQTPATHLSGRGCPFCSGSIKWTQEDFFKAAREVHGNEYEYLSEYKNTRTVMIIRHKKCNKTFKQYPNNHVVARQGCPFCKRSHGEQKVSLFLEKNNIPYKIQKSFNDCRNSKTNYLLRFDFFIPLLNTLIEYDGEFHYQDIIICGNELKCADAQRRDSLKNKYAKQNNIKLIRIPYTKLDEIENILSKELNI